MYEGITRHELETTLRVERTLMRVKRVGGVI